MEGMEEEDNGRRKGGKQTEKRGMEEEMVGRREAGAREEGELVGRRMKKGEKDG